MTFGNTPRGSDQVPLSSVYVPGTADLIALRGANSSTDGLGNASAQVVMILPDGSSTGTVTSDLDTVSLAIPGGQSTVLIQITGTFIGTLNFEASPDGGASWYSVTGSQAGTSVTGTFTTAVGAWRVGIAGFTHFRVRLHPVTSGTATLVLRFSSGIHNVFVSNASTLGQQTMANSASVSIASDQPPFFIKPTFTEQSTLSAGALNADLVPSTDISAYEEWSLQVAAVAVGGTLTFQGSNDGTTFVSVLAYPATASGSPVTSVSSTGMWYGPRKYRYLRVRQTAWTSGTSTGTLEAYTLASYQTTQSANAAQSGTWTVQPGNTQNTTPWLMAGPNANGTQAANSAANTVIKGSSGWLYHVIITTLGTAGLTIYDNATTNAGTPLLVIPASAAVGTIYSFPSGARAVNGITSGGVLNCPGVTFHYT